jgi:hypothetical protein
MKWHTNSVTDTTTMGSPVGIPMNRDVKHSQKYRNFSQKNLREMGAYLRQKAQFPQEHLRKHLRKHLRQNPQATRNLRVETNSGEGKDAAVPQRRKVATTGKTASG